MVKARACILLLMILAGAHPNVTKTCYIIPIPMMLLPSRKILSESMVLEMGCSEAAKENVNEGRAEGEMVVEFHLAAQSSWLWVISGLRVSAV